MCQNSPKDSVTGSMHRPRTACNDASKLLVISEGAVAVATPCCESWAPAYRHLSPPSAGLFVSPRVHKATGVGACQGSNTLRLATPLCPAPPLALHALSLSPCVIVGWGMCTPQCRWGSEGSLMHLYPLEPSRLSCMLHSCPMDPCCWVVLSGKTQVCLWYAVLVHQFYLNCLMPCKS